MKEKVWVFCYDTARVLCCTIDTEDDIEKYLESIDVNPNNCIWMSTTEDIEVEYIS